MSDITIPDAIKELLNIVERLSTSYAHCNKKFTLDGRLLGDIGEVLVEQTYDVTLFQDLAKHHDAKCSQGRLVQIKATMKKHLTFPADHVPDYLIGIRIRPDGGFDTIYNGPGVIAARAISNRGPSKTNLHSISLSALSALDKLVDEKERIPSRASAFDALGARTRCY